MENSSTDEERKQKQNFLRDSIVNENYDTLEFQDFLCSLNENCFITKFYN